MAVKLSQLYPRGKVQFKLETNKMEEVEVTTMCGPTSKRGRGKFIIFGVSGEIKDK